MIQYKEILRQFGINFSNEDEIRRIGVNLLEFKSRFASDLLSHIKKDARKNDVTLEELQKKYSEHIERWYQLILSARLNNCMSDFIMSFNADQTPKNYFDDEKIAAMFSFIRRWFQEKVYNISDAEWEFCESVKSYTNIIDASMYVVNRVYIKNMAGSYGDSKLKLSVLHFGERFSLITHITLLFFLACMTVGGIVYFIYSLFDLIHINPDKLFVSALGSLLVLWVLVELINSEIQMLQGDKFRISIFVGVVLIAFIRELLILSLKHDTNMGPMMALLAGVFVLGLTYWLLARSERSKD